MTNIGDRIRVLPSSHGPHKGEIGFVISFNYASGVAIIKPPDSGQRFEIHKDFLEDYEFDDEDS